MAYKQLYGGLRNGVYNYKLFVCDTEDDLDLLPTTTQRTEDKDVCSAGSEAIVIAGRKRYMLNTEDEWCVMVNYASPGGGTATVEVEDDGHGNVSIL